MAVLKLKVVDRVRIQAELPQSLSASVRVGTSIRIRGEALDRGAKITGVFPTVSAELRTFRIEAIVENRDRTIKPGMFLRMQLALSEASSQLAVRSSAVLTDADGGKYAWVLKEKQGGKVTDWTCTMHPEVSKPGPGLCPICKMDLVPREGTGRFTVERRSVKAGASDGAYTAIVSGLAEGEEVAWAGHEDLYPGAPVLKSEWGTNGPKTLTEGGVAPPGKKGSGAGGTTKTDRSESEEQGNEMPGMDMGGKK
jgi:multidrug efflux pump subunit AcrA (membrane-fusion protein)